MNNTLIEKLEKGIGNRILVMLESFPFFIVGKLEDVGDDYIYIKAESGVAVELRGTSFCINISNVASLYVEQYKGEIPTLNR